MANLVIMANLVMWIVCLSLFLEGVESIRCLGGKCLCSQFGDKYEVTCASQRLLSPPSLPDRMKANTTYIVLRGNYIVSVSDDYLVGMDSLVKLDITAQRFAPDCERMTRDPRVMSECRFVDMTTTAEMTTEGTTEGVTHTMAPPGWRPVPPRPWSTRPMRRTTTPGTITPRIMTTTTTTTTTTPEDVTIEGTMVYTTTPIPTNVWDILGLKRNEFVVLAIAVLIAWILVIGLGIWMCCKFSMCCQKCMDRGLNRRDVFVARYQRKRKTSDPEETELKEAGTSGTQGRLGASLEALRGERRAYAETLISGEIEEGEHGEENVVLEWLDAEGTAHRLRSSQRGSLRDSGDIFTVG